MEAIRHGCILFLIIGTELSPETFSTSAIDCPYRIPNGHIAADCSVKQESTCNFSCDHGCHKSSYIDTLTCFGPSGWYFAELACTCPDQSTTRFGLTAATSTLCPHYIPGGHVSIRCSRQPYSKCTVYCYSNCYRNIATLTCGSYGRWEFGAVACSCYGTTKAPERCSSSIPNGYILGDCDMKSFSSCDFSCNYRCVPTVSSLYCDGEGSWGALGDTACRCYDDVATTTTSSPPRSSYAGIIVGSILGTLAVIFIPITACFCYLRRASKRSTPHGDHVPRINLNDLESTPHRRTEFHTEAFDRPYAGLSENGLPNSEHSGYGRHNRELSENERSYVELSGASREVNGVARNDSHCAEEPPPYSAVSSSAAVLQRPCAGLERPLSGGGLSQTNASTIVTQEPPPYCVIFVVRPESDELPPSYEEATAHPAS